MKKKICAIMVLVTMMFSVMSVGVYAQSDSLTNFSGSVTPENFSCDYLEKAEATITISKDGAVAATAVVPYDEEEGGILLDADIEGVAEILAVAGPEVDRVWESDEDIEDPYNVLKDCGYDVEVTIEDGADDHEFIIDEIASTVMTAQIYEDIMTGFAEQWILLYEEEYEALTGKEVDEYEDDESWYVTIDGEPATLNDFISVDYRAFITDEDDLAQLDEIKMTYDAFQSGEYKGQLQVVVFTDCTCIVYESYTVYHEFYDAEGNCVAQEMIDGEAVAGTVLKAGDIELFEEYDGVKYKFDGFYLNPDEEEGWDFENPITEYTVLSNDESFNNICARYIAEADTAAADKDDVAKDKDDSPATGDESNMLPWFILAAMGLVVAAGARRTQKN